MWKRGEIAPQEQFSSFPHYFIFIFLTSGVKLHIHLLNVVVQFIILLTLSTLICRGTDISKCFIESLGIRDNESRLHIFPIHFVPLGDNLHEISNLIFWGNYQQFVVC